MALQGAGVSPGLHFHLAATINALTDIPLVPAINSSANVVHKFSLHWLNNKEIYFSLEAEKILQVFFALSQPQDMVPTPKNQN